MIILLKMRLMPLITTTKMNLLNNKQRTIRNSPTFKLPLYDYPILTVLYDQTIFSLNVCLLNRCRCVIICKVNPSIV